MELASKLSLDYVKSLESNKDNGRRVIEDPEIIGDQSIVRRSLHKELQDEELPDEQVVAELHRDATPGLVHTGSGRYFGFVIGGTLPAAIAADWLTSAWDPNAGAYFVSPSSAIAEEVAAGWVKDLLGLPSSASYAFVTGCQMAHVVALASARHRLLRERNWDVESQGLWGAPPIRVLVGQHHETIVRALRFLGMGNRVIEVVAVKHNGTIDVDDLRKKFEQDPDTATIVSLAAGELNTGMYDPIGDVCDVAHRYGAWVHVDGAFGLWAAASKRFKHLVGGLDKADSWAVDAHKLLNVPHDVGMVFVAHPESHRAAFQMHADYAVALNPQDEPRNQFDYGPEWSRRARGFVVYAALRSLGRNGVARLVENNCDLASELVDKLGHLDGVEVLARPILNQGLVRFVDPTGMEADHDRYTDKIISQIQKTGIVWFGGTKWNGMRVMRISVCSHRTCSNDVDIAVNVVKQVLFESQQPPEPAQHLTVDTSIQCNK